MDRKEIASTINSQLNWAGLPVRWSWGIHALQSLPKVNRFAGGLQAKVNGAKFKGTLRIYLTYGDDYTIQLGSVYRGAFRMKQEVQGIYCYELATTVDALIET